MSCKSKGIATFITKKHKYCNSRPYTISNYIGADVSTMKNVYNPMNLAALVQNFITGTFYILNSRHIHMLANLSLSMLRASCPHLIVLFFLRNRLTKSAF